MKEDDEINMFIVASNEQEIPITVTHLSNSNDVDVVAVFNLDKIAINNFTKTFRENEKVYIDTEEDITLEHIIDKCSLLKEEKDEVLVIIDYSKPLAEDEEIVGKELKQMSIDLDIMLEIVINVNGIIDNKNLMKYSNRILVKTPPPGILEIVVENGQIMKINAKS